MKRLAIASLAAVLWLGLFGGTPLGLFEPARAATSQPVVTQEDTPTQSSPAQSHFAVMEEYCFVCHSDGLEIGGLSLESFDIAHPYMNAETAEKMIRKLRAGMMPPLGLPRPEGDELQALVSWLETEIDAKAAEEPNPGHRTFQRLNRAEYERSVRELLAIDVDVAAFLPPDTISHSFDNIADVQTLSPTLMEGYLRAAAKISREAMGDPKSGPTEATYRVPRTASQLEHVDGAPFGTRGGLSVIHNFPADGEYRFKIQLHGTPTGELFGMTAENEQLEVSVNGERKALLEIDYLMEESDPNGLILETEPVAIKAGAQRVSAAFIERFNGPVDDLMAPIEHSLADTQIGMAYGITTLPHLRFFSISGPFNVTGVSDTPSRRAIFSCRPTSASDELPCAEEIVRRLASEAYRRPVSDADMEGLMSFYAAGAEDSDFESGIRTSVQAILASPRFVFRLEETPSDVEPGTNYRIAGLDLASRLSFFLWASAPDDELIHIANQGALADPVVFEQQVRRMLADPRSEALATRFASQWLRLQDLDKIHPDALYYPQYDQTLAAAMKRESELLFEYLIREDRSVLDLLTADYTFVNERLAKHYGIPNITGTRFRRVELTDENRRGLLGHGSILTQTSIADRTSPVLRGKWVLEVFLGAPPPPPPPNVPALEETSAAAEGKLLSVRERMESHRSNPACLSCHSVIDPLGLALENFDVTGAWRIRDNGNPIDASGELYDGTPLNGPVDLRNALLDRSDVFLTTFTESLMTYGLGRRIEPADMPTIRSIVRSAEANDYRISAFILGVVESPAFQMSRAEGDVQATEAQ